MIAVGSWESGAHIAPVQLHAAGEALKYIQSKRTFHEIAFFIRYIRPYGFRNWYTYTVHGNAESDVQDTILGKLRAKFPIYPLSAYIAVPAVRNWNWSKVGVKIMNIQPPPRTSSMGISGHLRQFHVGAGCHWRRIPACSGDTRAPGVKTPR